METTDWQITMDPTMTNITQMTTMSTTPVQRSMDNMTLIMVTVFGIICTIGLIGNSLVIFVITRYTKMKTVTNMYILNLSITDGVFLLGLPMIMTTAVMGRWTFGSIPCKIFYVSSCVNQFTGAFTLTAMAGDRYLAVCHPITAIRLRTPRYASFALVVIWTVSCFVILPVVMYARLKPQRHDSTAYTCFIDWPSIHLATSQKLFTTYMISFSFILPVLVISILYALLVVRLKTSGSMTSGNQSHRQRSQSEVLATQVKRCERKHKKNKKVTRLVSLIIVVFIALWSPYWTFQLYLITANPTSIKRWLVNMFQVFTLLSHANSMVNPVLYAFTNASFKESFAAAFTCSSDTVLNTKSRRFSEAQSRGAGPKTMAVDLNKQTYTTSLIPQSEDKNTTAL